MNNVRLSVVVPCFNEEKNIPKMLNNFALTFGHTTDVEILLVDNGSQDKTGEVIDHEIKVMGYRFVRKVVVPVNQGYGYGILAGLKEAKGECLAWTHADLQTDPQDVLKGYQYYQDAAQGERRILVKGHRRNRKITEKLLSLGMQLTSSLALGVWLTEVNAQPKVFPRALYEAMENPPQDFSLDLYLLYLAIKKGYAILSFSVYFNKRLFGEAKGGGGSDFKTRWKLIKRTFNYIFELRRQVLRRPVS